MCASGGRKAPSGSCRPSAQNGGSKNTMGMGTGQVPTKWYAGESPWVLSASTNQGQTNHEQRRQRSKVGSAWGLCGGGRSCPVRCGSRAPACPGGGGVSKVGGVGKSSTSECGNVYVPAAMVRSTAYACCTARTKCWKVGRRLHGEAGRRLNGAHSWQNAGVSAAGYAGMGTSRNLGVGSIREQRIVEIVIPEWRTKW